MIVSSHPISNPLEASRRFDGSESRFIDFRHVLEIGSEQVELVFLELRKCDKLFSYCSLILDDLR